MSVGGNGTTKSIPQAGTKAPRKILRTNEVSEMEGTLDYANFRAWVPRNVLTVGAMHPQEWTFYDWGPRAFSEPLVCLHPVVGSAEVFHRQVLGLAERGYRVVATQLPVYWTVSDFCDGFHTFLDMLKLRRIHIYGAGLGGYLALQYASKRPERVASMVLTHTFLSTESVSHKIIYSPGMLQWLPDILVRNAVQAMFPKGRASLHVAEAAEFAIHQTMALSREQLASRLSLLVAKSSVLGRIRVGQERITFIDVVGITNPSSSARAEEMYQALPNARRALLKDGGHFPYLGSPDDVTMHLVVHMRRLAKPPAEAGPLPPPARPIPVLYVHADLDEQRKANGGRPALTKTDFRAIAEQRADLLEQERLRRYRTELQLTRKYVEGFDTEFLAAALEDCDGNVDLAAQRLRSGHYKKRFYARRRDREIRRITRELQEQEAEAARLREESERQGTTDPHGSASDLEDTGHEPSSDHAVETEHQVPAQSPSTRGDHADAQQSRPENVTWDKDAAPKTDTGQNADVASRDGTARQAGESTDMSLPFSNVPTSSAPGSPPEPDRVFTSFSTSPHRADLDYGARETASSDDGDLEGESVGATPRRPRRSNEFTTPLTPADSTNTYLTSGSTRIRDDGPLIGRGPTPVATPQQDLQRWNSGNRERVSQHMAGLDIVPTPRFVQDDALDTGTDEDSLHVPGWDSIETTPVASTMASMDNAFNLDVAAPPQAELPQDAVLRVVPDIPASAPPRIHAPGLPTADAAKTIRQGDSWDQFRSTGLVTLENAGPPNTESPESGSTKAEDEERLREWMMSAQSASETARSALRNENA